MFRLQCDITIGNYRLTRVNKVEIKQSKKQLADKCTLTLPTSAILQQENATTAVETAKAIKVGDAVTVQLGYNDVLTEEFVGYVRRVNYTLPVTVDCEDAVYFLRKTTVNKSWKETTLEEVLTDILNGTGVGLASEVPELEFTTFYVKNMNVAQALQKFVDEYGLIMYMKGNNLYVGLTDEELGTARYKLGVNVVSHDIKYRTADDVRLKVKAVHVLKDNTRTEVEVGDEDGELRTFFFYDVESEAQLKELATKKLEDAKIEGYDGKLTGFLIPFVQHSYVVHVEDEDYPDRSGDYAVDAVTVKYGVSGARREVELGYKIE